MPGVCFREQCLPLGTVHAETTLKRVVSLPLQGVRQPVKKFPWKPLNDGGNHLLGAGWLKQAAPLLSRIVCQGTADRQATNSGGLLLWLTERGYQMTGILFTAFGLVAMFYPSKLSASALKLESSPFIAYASTLASTLCLIAGYFAFSIKDAVANNRLSSNTYKRMAQWLALERIVNLVIKMPLLKEGGTLSTGLTTVSVATPLAVTILFMMAYKSFPINLAMFTGVLSAVKATLQPSSIVALCYSVVVAGATAFAICFLAVPNVGAPYTLTDLASAKALSGTLTQKDVLLVRVLGLLFSYYAVSAFILRDAAERGRLGASTFKNLNLTLAVVATVNSIFKVAYASAANQWPCWSTLGTVYIALLCGFQYLTAKG